MSDRGSPTQSLPRTQPPDGAYPTYPPRSPPFIPRLLESSSSESTSDDEDSVHLRVRSRSSVGLEGPSCEVRQRDWAQSVYQVTHTPLPEFESGASPWLIVLRQFIDETIPNLDRVGRILVTFLGQVEGSHDQVLIIRTFLLQHILLATRVGSRLRVRCVASRR